MWHPRRFDDDGPPEDVAAAVHTLRERLGQEPDVAGLVAHSPGAANALAAMQQTLSFQSRLAPHLRCQIHLAVAAALDAGRGLDLATTRAQAHGVTNEAIAALREGRSDEPLVTLARQLATGEGPARKTWEAVSEAGWSTADAVEAIVVAAEFVPVLWLLRCYEPDEPPEP